MVAAYPGASPEVVEQQVTVPLEDNLRGVPVHQTTSIVDEIVDEQFPLPARQKERFPTWRGS
ncbi:hypothetical protein [Saccharopolyspora pogona]|uniref:hypothetical protein n=1 Tax=Saccharopolyspora pogona TaxID=333966 RepID=UPI0021E0DAD4|nr:hypothetical protein [Saccharopolyspora pogona]